MVGPNSKGNAFYISPSPAREAQLKNQVGNLEGKRMTFLLETKVQICDIKVSCTIGHFTEREFDFLGCSLAKRKIETFCHIFMLHGAPWIWRIFVRK